MNLPQHPRLSEPHIQRAVRATGGCLFIMGWLIPTMLAQMPLIRERLDLSEDRISWFILAIGLGALPAMLGAGMTLSRLGSKRAALIFLPIFLLFPPLFGAVSSFPMLITLGFLLGLVSGFFDAAANTQGSLLERLTGRYFMTWIHAMFAAGVLVGAGLSTLAQWAQMPTALFLGLLSLASSPLLLLIATSFVGLKEEQALELAETQERSVAFPRRSLFLLACLCLLMVLGVVAEAAHYDWLALYTVDVFFEPPGGWVSEAQTRQVAHFGSLALVVFSAGLLVARLAGDRLAASLGRPRLLLGCALLGCLALSWVILSPSYALSLPAIFFMGAGFAMFFPVFVAAAGRLNGIPAALGVSIVAAMGWASIFVGPPVIGFVAEHFSYRWAYVFLLPPALLVAIFGPWVVFKSRSENH